MNGKDLLEAMSYVDEAYIQEAEEPVRRRIHWVRYTAMAACLALVFAGWNAYQKISRPMLAVYYPQEDYDMRASYELVEEKKSETSQSTPMMKSSSCTMKVRFTGMEGNIMLCTVEDGGNTGYPAGTELRIAVPESFRAADLLALEPEMLFDVVLDSEALTEEVLHPVEMIPRNEE